MFSNTILHPLGALDYKLLESCIENQTKTQNYRALDVFVDKLYDNECDKYSSKDKSLHGFIFALCFKIKINPNAIFL